MARRALGTGGGDAEETAEAPAEAPAEAETGEETPDSALSAYATAEFPYGLQVIFDEGVGMENLRNREDSLRSNPHTCGRHRHLPA